MYSRMLRICILAGALAGLSVLDARLVWAGVQTPACDALETWAVTIDKNDRWEPAEGVRQWLPRAFEGKAFESLFGAPAMTWSNDDAKAVGAHLTKCAKMAAKQKRTKAQKALYGARGFVKKIPAVIARIEQAKARAAAKQKKEEERQARREQMQAEKAARKEAAIAAALEDLLAQPDSPQLLRSLAMLRAVDMKDPSSVGNAYGQMPVPAARGLLDLLYKNATDIGDPRIAPKLEARYRPLHDGVMEAKLAEIETLPNGTNSLLALNRLPAKLKSELGPALAPDDENRLAMAIADKRAIIREAILTRGRAMIREASADAAGIQRIQAIKRDAGKAGLLPDQLAALRQDAELRQAEIGDLMLEAAAVKLDGYPATMAGLDNLTRYIQQVGQNTGGHASPVAKARFAKTATARVDTIARDLLPEFKQRLATLPEDKSGLDEAEKAMREAQRWRVASADVRQDYVDAARARHGVIQAALQAQWRADRQTAIDAGGDPELVGYTFVDKKNGSTLEFRDQRLVFMTMLGMKFAGEYEVSRNDVIVKGPNGSIVFTRDGSKLTGMGFEMSRVE